MDFVDDDHAVSVSGWVKLEKLPQFPHVVDATIGGAVHLNHVDARAVRDLLARGTLAAGLGGRSLQAVDGLGEQPRGGGLADPPQTRE